jgi:hypothetical protein
MRTTAIALAVLLAACTDPEPTPADHCYEFLATYCVVMDECNPPGWFDECVTNAASHCADFGGPVPDDTEACLDLMRDARCEAFGPELQACWSTYTE